MHKYIIANHKMNLTLVEVSSYIENLKPYNYNNVIICPTLLFADLFIKNGFEVGSQNINKFEKGSFTGEVSPYQLKTAGVNYSIVGHSERRQLYNETDLDVNKKLNSALKNEIIPIMCIGETKEEKDMHRTNLVLKKQIERGLNNIPGHLVKKIIIAYEPIWAIGTGLIPTLRDIEVVNNYIKSLTEKLTGASVAVLYGGSVNESNIKDLNSIENCDGFLIGGASLKAAEFINIIKEVNKI